MVVTKSVVQAFIQALPADFCAFSTFFPIAKASRAITTGQFRSPHPIVPLSPFPTFSLSPRPSAPTSRLPVLDAAENPSLNSPRITKLYGSQHKVEAGQYLVVSA